MLHHTRKGACNLGHVVVQLLHSVRSYVLAWETTTDYMKPWKLVTGHPYHWRPPLQSEDVEKLLLIRNLSLAAGLYTSTPSSVGRDPAIFAFHNCQLKLNIMGQ